MATSLGMFDTCFINFEMLNLIVSSVLANPENPPAIKFDEYRQKVSTKEAVQQIEAAYKALKIPYPKDTLSPEVDAQEVDYKKKSQEYVGVANAKIAEAEKLVSLWVLIYINRFVY